MARPSRAYRLWKQAWVGKETPWENPDADNPLLRAIGKRGALKVPRGASVLVPLCGRSPVIRALHRMGYQVSGVEYVPQAVALLKKQFGKKRWQRRRLKSGVVHTTKDIKIYQQDFFRFNEKAEYSLIYDRAAFVAINPRHRVRYARILKNALKPGGVLFLVCFVMRGAQPKGPPFTASTARLTRIFRGLRLVGKKSIVDSNPPARYPGVRKIIYTSYIFRRAR